MPRQTKYNNITSDEKLRQINKKNQELSEEYLDYLVSIDRAPTTIEQYKSDLKIFFCWNLEFNKNKFFIECGKRDFMKFQNYAIKTWEWSPKRIRRVKSTLSSLSNFIENILDEEEEFENFKPIVRKIENPVNVSVREKTVFEDEVLETLLDKLVERQEYRKACMLALAMFSGRRKSELPRFKTSYFSKDNVIFGSLYKTPEKVRTKGKGSRGKMIELYVLKNKFDPYLNLWLKERERLGINSIWLFPKYKNGEWLDEQMDAKTLDSWAETFSKIIKTDFYWHSLRHYFTTSMSRSGLPDSIIQSIVGWESSEMVKIYNDRSTDESLAKYFDENGIKDVKQTTLSDL